MHPTFYNSRLIVDLTTILNNYTAITQESSGSCLVIPVLKCNAYGIGALQIAQTILKKYPGQLLAVAQVQEAAELRSQGIHTPLLLLGGIPAKAIPEAVRLNLQITLFNPETARLVQAEAARQNKSAYPVHLKIETGLNRIGAKPGEELQELILTLRQCENLDVAGCYSHFIDGENENSPLAFQQARLFEAAVEQLQQAGIHPPLLHLCASGSSEWFPDNSFNAMRIGRRLFMDSPSLEHQLRQNSSIRECCSWRSQIVATRTIAKGEHAGYFQRFTAPQDTTIAIVSVGYGDGLLPELARKNAPVLVNNARARLIETAMDQCFLDVTGLDCHAGDEVTFFGYSSGGAFLSSQEVAALIQDEGVYLTTFLSNRVERVYLGAD